MKKIAVYFLVFLLSFLLLSNGAYSDDDDDDDYPKKRLIITSVHVDMEIEVIYINGKNLGKHPYVLLDDHELEIAGVPTNTLIEALLPANLDPGTYRLLVAKRKPKRRLKASQTDTMDVTIGGYTETDPIFTDSPASGIFTEDITNWNDAYGWGDHALIGYLASESDPVFGAWDKSTGISITESQITDLDHFTNADETDPVFGAHAAALEESAEIDADITAHATSGDHDARYVNVTGDTMTGGLNVQGNIAVSGTVDGYEISAKGPNWDTAYTDRLKWDGSATGLVAATGRTSLGLGSLATLSAVSTTEITDGTIANADLGSGSFTNITGVGTLGSLTVSGGANLATTSGNVGIGRTNPYYKLHVNGDIRGQNIYGTIRANKISDLGCDGIGFEVCNVEKMYIFGSKIRSRIVYSNVVSGGVPVKVNSNGSIGTAASIRKAKTNIQEDFDISWLYKLKPVKFNYRKKIGEREWSDREFEKEKNYGLIAEDVEKVNKDLVFYNYIEDHKKKGKKSDSKSHEELIGVSYDKLIGVLVKVVQEQKVEIDALKKRISKLEKK